MLYFAGICLASIRQLMEFAKTNNYVIKELDLFPSVLLYIWDYGGAVHGYQDQGVGQMRLPSLEGVKDCLHLSVADCRSFLGVWSPRSWRSPAQVRCVYKRDIRASGTPVECSSSHDPSESTIWIPVSSCVAESRVQSLRSSFGRGSVCHVLESSKVP